MAILSNSIIFYIKETVSSDEFFCTINNSSLFLLFLALNVFSPSRSGVIYNKTLDKPLYPGVIRTNDFFRYDRNAENKWNIDQKIINFDQQTIGKCLNCLIESRKRDIPPIQRFVKQVERRRSKDKRCLSLESVDVSLSLFNPLGRYFTS